MPFHVMRIASQGPLTQPEWSYFFLSVSAGIARQRLLGHYFTWPSLSVVTVSEPGVHEPPPVMITVCSGA